MGCISRPGKANWEGGLALASERAILVLHHLRHDSVGWLRSARFRPDGEGSLN